MFATVDPILLKRLYIRTALRTGDLEKACADKLGGDPVEVRRAVEPDAEPQRCFWNVAAHVERNGGDIVFGWSIHEWPHLFWEAQHHAVWRAPDGELVDITPPAAAGGTVTLFVEDPASTFDLESGFEQPADTQRFQLVAWPELRSYSDAGENIRIRRQTLSRQRHAADRMLQNFITVERCSKEALLLELANTLDGVAHCFCGSGQTFEQCCRPRFR